MKYDFFLFSFIIVLLNFIIHAKIHIEQSEQGNSLN